ncbi:hypothetical protein AMTRI_Chr05g62540 [Amborella trichopoda]
MRCRMRRSTFLNHQCTHVRLAECSRLELQGQRRRWINRLDNIVEAINNLRLLMDKRPSNPLTVHVGDAISKIQGLIATTRMIAGKEIVRDADVTTLFLNKSKEDRIEYVLDVYGVHGRSPSP